jgi:hypothetical protein
MEKFKKFIFEKFMNDIVRREEMHKTNINPNPDDIDGKTPQQRYNELYRERWQNRIKWQPPKAKK